MNKDTFFCTVALHNCRCHFLRNSHDDLIIACVPENARSPSPVRGPNQEAANTDQAGRRTTTTNENVYLHRHFPGAGGQCIL